MEPQQHLDNMLALDVTLERTLIEQLVGLPDDKKRAKLNNIIEKKIENQEFKKPIDASKLKQPMMLDKVKFKQDAVSIERERTTVFEYIVEALFNKIRNKEPEYAGALNSNLPINADNIKSAVIVTSKFPKDMLASMDKNTAIEFIKNSIREQAHSQGISDAVLALPANNINLNGAKASVTQTTVLNTLATVEYFKAMQTGTSEILKSTENHINNGLILPNPAETKTPKDIINQIQPGA